MGFQDNEVLNINADIATVELVKAIISRPSFCQKLRYLNKTGQLIPNINLALEYNELIRKMVAFWNETKIRANKIFVRPSSKNSLCIHNAANQSTERVI